MDKLLKSLSKFQKENITVELDGSVKYGNTNFKYSTLQNLMRSTRDGLIKNDLLVTQIIENGNLVTILYHTSGEQIRSSIHLPECSNPQDLGKWISYTRRYQYASILGLVSEDDDDGQVKEEAKKPANRQPKKVIKEMSNDNFKKCVTRFNEGEKDVFDKAKKNGYTFNEFQLDTIKLAEGRKQRLPEPQEIF